MEAVEHEPSYLVTCSSGVIGQVLVDIALADACLAADDRAPALTLSIEVNDGLPCIHVHGGPAQEELAATIFGTLGGGVLIRDGDTGSDCQKVREFHPSLADVTTFVADTNASAAIAIDAPNQT